MCVFIIGMRYIYIYTGYRWYTYFIRQTRALIILLRRACTYTYMCVYNRRVRIGVFREGFIFFRRFFHVCHRLP